MNSVNISSCTYLLLSQCQAMLSQLPIFPYPVKLEDSYLVHVFLGKICSQENHIDVIKHIMHFDRTPKEFGLVPSHFGFNR